MTSTKYLVTPQIQDLLDRIDLFIEDKLVPLQKSNDNERFFDHRREWARTDWDNHGLPRKDWEALLHKMERLADEAGFFRLPMPKELGGQECGNLVMAIVREHFTQKGLGLHCDIQNESAMVGNKPLAIIVQHKGSPQQKEEFIPKLMSGEYQMAFGLTEPAHGSDATHMDTNARREANDWIINGEKTWNTGVHIATHDLIVARTSGKPGDAKGLTAFIVPTTAKGFQIHEYLWTFNMPTDHARISLTNVRVPNSAILGREGEGLGVVGMFINENRIRQAASSLGTAVYCIQESVAYAKSRKLFGKPISTNQAIQWPLVEYHTEAEMLRLLIRETAAAMDTMSQTEIGAKLSDRVSMCNYRANRLACQAADFAIQVFGGQGYSRHKPFEHLYRHHRRYRITEGSEEIQKRNVAKALFGFGKGAAVPVVSHL